MTGHWKADGLAEPPDESVVGTPPRRPASVRRTAHINMTWPGGHGTPMHMDGRARDLLTRSDGSAEILGEGAMHVVAGDFRTIEAISVVPDHPRIGSLEGASGGRRFRAAIDEALPGERESATPLYFILDDIAGCTLIGGFAWSQHGPMVYPEGAGVGAGPAPGPGADHPRRTREGRIICSGLRPGGYHEVSRQRGIQVPHYLRVAGNLEAGDLEAGNLESAGDSMAWHEIEPAPQVCMRRRRRIDAWWDGEDIEVDGHFRDSMWSRDHVEIALHEYTLSATIHAESHVLKSIEATPRVLPFPECPWAAPHTGELIGMPVDGFRASVQDALTELHCCTHLNDMLRGLAEVPALARSAF